MEKYKKCLWRLVEYEIVSELFKLDFNYKISLISKCRVLFTTVNTVCDFRVGNKPLESRHLVWERYFKVDLKLSCAGILNK